MYISTTNKLAKSTIYFVITKQQELKIKQNIQDISLIKQKLNNSGQENARVKQQLDGLKTQLKNKEKDINKYTNIIHNRLNPNAVRDILRGLGINTHVKTKIDDDLNENLLIPTQETKENIEKTDPRQQEKQMAFLLFVELTAAFDKLNRDFPWPIIKLRFKPAAIKLQFFNSITIATFTE